MPLSNRITGITGGIRRRVTASGQTRPGPAGSPGRRHLSAAERRGGQPRGQCQSESVTVLLGYGVPVNIESLSLSHDHRIIMSHRMTRIQ